MSAARRTDGRFFDAGEEELVVKVLLGVGGRDDSALALDRTVERAREAGDDLTVAVFDDTGTGDAVAVERRVRTALEDAGVDATITRLDGDAGSALVELAETGGFDRVVVGGGERSPMGKVQVGSVAQFAVVNASVTVTLVR